MCQQFDELEAFDSLEGHSSEDFDRGLVAVILSDFGCSVHVACLQARKYAHLTGSR